MKQAMEYNIFESSSDKEQEKSKSVIDFLASRYLEENPVSSEEIDAIQTEMDPYYENIPFSASAKLFQLVYDLCGCYESAAFREGLRIGLCLRNEIATERNT